MKSARYLPKLFLIAATVFVAPQIFARRHVSFKAEIKAYHERSHYLRVTEDGSGKLVAQVDYKKRNDTYSYNYFLFANIDPALTSQLASLFQLLTVKAPVTIDLKAEPSYDFKESNAGKRTRKIYRAGINDVVIEFGGRQFEAYNLLAKIRRDSTGAAAVAAEMIAQYSVCQAAFGANNVDSTP